MKALILAAASGTRLRPLSEKRPKVFISVVGRPLISYPLANLKKASIKKVAIVIKLQDKTKFKSTLRKYHFDFEFFFQQEPQGTLKAIEAAKNFFREESFY